jgi:ribosomal protein S18 acetylase RimI-like enzyme
MDEIRYRRAEPADVPSLALLPSQGEPGDAADGRMLPYLLGEHHPQQALASRVMWMALDGDSPVGYIAGHLTRRFDCEGELQYLYVLPAHRGGRIAAGLLRQLARWFVEQGARRVCVDVGNGRARRFYTRHGAAYLRKHWLVWEDIGEVLGGGAPLRPTGGVR